MLEWLVPVALYPLIVSAWVGGTGIRIEGGSPLREVLALVIGFVVFLVVWWVVKTAVAAVAGTVLGVVVGALGAALALPLVVWAGFRAVGVRASAFPVEGGAAH